MSGIAGIARAGEQLSVNRMLDRISHRGTAARVVLETNDATLGAVCTEVQAGQFADLVKNKAVRDAATEGYLAEAKVSPEGLILIRDQVGRAPLYYGRRPDGAICFASEVKALLEFTCDINELSPGCTYRSASDRLETYFQLQEKALLSRSTEEVVNELYRRLLHSVERCVAYGQSTVGCWLSGGIDSSTMAALARQFVERLYTFSAGVSGSPDLEYARIAAEFLGSDHHEIVVTCEDMLALLPEVIYHLESFDALLVRSSIVNYLAAKVASDYVPVVLSGEGGDELFAGYEYIKSLDLASVPGELIDITKRLHNTALQRVDRTSTAHGVLALVGFLEPNLVDYALCIPPELKLHGRVEKWILRRVMDGRLPEVIVSRGKAKFWEGAGVADQLSRYAEAHISDSEFQRERELPNGEMLNTKEELMYYRIFKEHFGEFENLSWLGRTKGAPVV